MQLFDQKCSLLVLNFLGLFSDFYQVDYQFSF